MATDPMKIAEDERPLQTRQPVNLQREVWHLMHRHARAVQAVREQAGRKAADDQDQLRALIVDLAGAHHQLRRFLEQHTTALADAELSVQVGLLATIRDRYEQVFKRVGAELVYLDDQPFTFKVSSQAKVTAWVPADDVDQPRVRETVSPGVLLNDELICPVQVELTVPAHPTSSNDEPQETTDEPRDRD
jgi:hypothetical protein